MPRLGHDAKKSMIT